MPAHRFKIRHWLGLIGLLIIFSALVMETYLRLKTTFIVSRNGAVVEQDVGLLVRYTSKGKRLVPNAHVIIRNHYLSHKDVIMDINALGYRDAEVAREKKPGERRVLVLGDSITWGDYLQDNEIYLERAEHYLNAALPERNVQLVNAGVADIGLKEEIDILEETGLSISPDVVVVAYYLNDSRPPWGFPAEVADPGWLLRRSLLAERLYRAVRLRQWLLSQGADRFAWIQAFPKMRWADDPVEFMRLVSMAQYDWGAAWTDDANPVLDRELDRLKALSLQHGFAVAIVAFPVSFQVYAKALHNLPQRRMASATASRNFAYLDLLPLLRAHAGEDLFFDQCHPREKTNDLIGTELARFLQQTYGWQ